jgi:cyclopropane fatty-acyl-phospholipid synthase-like methyltransferase
MVMDRSNGYEKIAKIFIRGRGKAIHGIGASSVRAWVRGLPKQSTLLDLGCGTGIPISKVLMDEAMIVYGVDASPTMVKTFRKNFPNIPVACEAAEESSFFNRQFDGIVAWGLMFLLPVETQERLIQKAAQALHPGGRLLFTATRKEHTWKDAMTDQRSISLGAARYRELIVASGLLPVEEFEDEGENYYFHATTI